MRHTNQEYKNTNEFEYETLPSAQRASIQALTLEIRESLKKTVDTIWQIGKNLFRVREQIDIRRFNLWLKAEFGWSRRTAYNFINVYEAFPESMRANFARIDISTSALYLLAAPSTPSEIRINFFKRAVDGERISYKVVRQSIDEAKSRSSSSESELSKPELNFMTARRKHALLASDRQLNARSSTGELRETTATVEVDLDTVIIQPTNFPIASDSLQNIETDTEETSFIHPAWNSIQKEFSLFWGDTMSPRFNDRLPDKAFVLAVPSIQWHHDWLANDSRCCIAIPRSQWEYCLVKQLLSALAENKMPLILPWIPGWRTIELALGLDLKVYAGDPSLERCEQTITKLGLDPQQIDRIRW